MHKMYYMVVVAEIIICIIMYVMYHKKRLEHSGKLVLVFNFFGPF
jgi:hypothetical protein